MKPDRGRPRGGFPAQHGQHGGETVKTIGVVGVRGGWSSEVLADILERKTGRRLLVDMERAVADLETGRVTYGDTDLTALDGLIVKKITPVYTPDALDRLELLRLVEGAGARVFSPALSMLRLVDRLACTVSLRLAGIPIPPTVVTEHASEALEAVQRFGRAVFKPLYTSKARGMAVIEDGPGALERVSVFRNAGNPVMYIQKLMHGFRQDMGLAFLGGEYIGAYARRGSQQSWNTTTQSGGKYVPCKPRPESIELAIKAQALFHMDFTCVDVAETDQGPMVFEVSAFGGFRGLWEALGLNMAELYADYVLARV